jgi:hypothetical protein
MIYINTFAPHLLTKTINMKKVFLVLTAVAVTTLSYAQVQFGVKAGVNIATATGSGTDGASKTSLINFNAGGLVSIPVSDAFSVQPELVYSGQGVKGTQDGISVTDNLSYINVPILAKYMIASGFSVEAGPQIGFLLSAKEKATEGGVTQTATIPNTSSVDFSIAAGVSYLLSSNNLGFDARYNIGLTNVNNGPDASSDEIKNSVIQIGVFYMFGEKSGKK